MLCALSTTNRSFISPCEKISSFYWLAKHWFRCGDSFGRYLRYFNIDQYSDIVFKINNRNVSEDIYTIILSIAIIYFCNRDFPLSVLEKDAAKLEENQSDEPVLLAPFCDAYQLTQRERSAFVTFRVQNKSRYSQRTIPINRDSKTHIHNIFVKLEVNKRAEVLSVINFFLNNKLNI